MANYDWRESAISDLSARFPIERDIIGVEQWQQLVAALGRAEHPNETIPQFPDAVGAFDRFLNDLPATRRLPSMPRVFVSHQRDDWRLAERVAWQATEVGFEYWLDVHDPKLAWANRAVLPVRIRALLIAAIIEIALLNSTHVVALHTSKSQHSRWIPYEFGRAKQRLPASWNAASWFEAGIAPDPKGDYLSLAYCAATEQKLESWFANQAGAHMQRPNLLWPMLTVPGQLPN